MRIDFAHQSRAICAIAILAMALLCGCAAPSPETPKPQSDAVQAPTAPSANTTTHDRASPTQTSPAPTPHAADPQAPLSPAQTERTGDRLADKAPGIESRNVDTSTPDRSCKTDSDCAVKDIGNCCGYFPMCVNKNAKTDPAAVRAQCEKSGVASICGFQEVKGCQCVQGRCENNSDGAVAM